MYMFSFKCVIAGLVRNKRYCTLHMPCNTYRAHFCSLATMLMGLTRTELKLGYAENFFFPLKEKKSHKIYLKKKLSVDQEKEKHIHMLGTCVALS